MLDEKIRIFAGLQENIIVENQIFKLIEKENSDNLINFQRSENKIQTISSQYNIFQEKIIKYKEMIDNISQLLEEHNTKEFLHGIYESKYNYLQKMIDIIINDNLTTTMTYLDEHYSNIKNELDAIILLNENIDENNGTMYFVAETLINRDTKHEFNILLFKHKTLEEKIANEIPYGAAIIYLTDELSIVKHDGKRSYTYFTKEQLLSLEKKGFLI